MQSPDGTPGICEDVEIQITQPTGKVGPPEPGGGEPVCRRRGSSDRFDRIDGLARELEDYRSNPGDPIRSRVHRERFYQGVWELAGRFAQLHLRSQNWKGDVTQDAMDITAGFCERLLTQEKNQKGIFGSAGRSSSQLRGYLNRTLHIGVKQQAGKFRRSRRQWLSFEEDAVLAAVTARKGDWLPQVLRLTEALDKAREGVGKLPAVAVGTTSLDLVLRLALNRKVHGGEAKKLIPRAGVATRTRQRREKELRDALRCELEM
jgi:hypothetical protein